MLDRYFDNAATTPVDERVLREMLPFFSEAFGNANSIHSFGQRAHEAVELARERIASLLGADDPLQIIFTSGATEANNWILSSLKPITSPFEHSSLDEYQTTHGGKFLPHSGTTLGQPDAETICVSVMAINNETGTMFDLEEFKHQPYSLHSDITQAFGKVPISVEGLDYASASAHKLYGPKGVGLLYCIESPPEPLFYGGEQELGFRAGTINVPAVVGFGVAAEIASQEWQVNLAHASDLRGIVLEELKQLSDWQWNGGDRTSPYILSLSFKGVQGETLVVECDQAGFAISSGAACSSHSTEPSRVLTRLGMEESLVRGTVRLSFSRLNTKESACFVGRTLRQTVEKLRRMA